MTARPLAGSSRARSCGSFLRSVALPAARLAAGLFGAAGCRREPQSAEELFERIRDATVAGRPGDVWDLQTTTAVERWKEAIRNTKQTATANPGARGINISQFIGVADYDAFMRMTDREIFDRYLTLAQKVLVDAKIVDRTTDPENGTDVWIILETSAKQRFRWVMRYEAGAGWRWESGQIVKAE